MGRGGRDDTQGRPPGRAGVAHHWSLFWLLTDRFEIGASDALLAVLGRCKERNRRDCRRRPGVRARKLSDPDKIAKSQDSQEWVIGKARAVNKSSWGDLKS